MAVEVDGHVYVGVGGSKKIAKCRAAEEALKSFIQFPNHSNVVNHKTNSFFQYDDFTKDSFESPANPSFSVSEAKKASKSAVMLLHELYPNAKFFCEENETDLYARFKITVTIGDDKFSGTGSSKKLAKNAASTVALTKLTSYTTPLLPTSENSCRIVSREEQEQADLIGR